VHSRYTMRPWCRERDSNSQKPVPKTGASSNCAIAALCSGGALNPGFQIENLTSWSARRSERESYSIVSQRVRCYEITRIKPRAKRIGSGARQDTQVLIESI
jgi:hypothetical protein